MTRKKAEDILRRVAVVLNQKADEYRLARRFAVQETEIGSVEVLYGGGSFGAARYDLEDMVIYVWDGVSTSRPRRGAIKEPNDPEWVRRVTLGLYAASMGHFESRPDDAYLRGQRSVFLYLVNFVALPIQVPWEEP